VTFCWLHGGMPRQRVVKACFHFWPARARKKHHKEESRNYTRLNLVNRAILESGDSRD